MSDGIRDINDNRVSWRESEAKKLIADLPHEIQCECLALLHLAVLAEMQARTHAQSLLDLLVGEVVGGARNLGRMSEGMPELIGNLAGSIEMPADIYSITMKDLILEALRGA